MGRVGPCSQAPTRFGEEGSELCMSVCLLYCGLPHRDTSSGWQACHGPVSVLSHTNCGSMGLMRSSNRMTKGCRETGTGRGGDEERKTRRRRRRRTLTGGRGFVRVCRISDENEAVTD